MSFGFSAGDFVASILLIKDVVQALDASTGAVTEVIALLSKLQSLKQAVLTSEYVYQECGVVDMNDGASLVAKTMRSSIEEERKRCDEILDSFIKSLKPYQDAFSSP